MLRATSASPGTFVERLAGAIGAQAGASAVFGPVTERGGVTVIPVAASRFGFGGGSGEGGPDGQSGSGGGGGALSRPLGFIEIAGGRARFRRIADPVTIGVALVAVAIALGVVARALAALCRPCPSCGRRAWERRKGAPSEETGAEAGSGSEAARMT
jgi:uncharacterized spore protein YtfJ